MSALHLALLFLTAASATAVALVRDPRRQVVVQSFFGLVLAILFLSFQAPDVAISEIAVGVVAIPLMLLLALAKVRDMQIRSHRKPEGE